MPRLLKTLRARLAALNMAVFGVILSAVCILVLTVGENYLRQDFDDWLTGLATSIAADLAVSETIVPPVASPGRQSRLWIPFDLPGLYLQVRSVDGIVLERSRSLENAVLPLSEAAARTHDTETALLETVTRATSGALAASALPLRMLTLYRDDANGRPYYLQVAVSAARLDNALGRLHKLIVVFTAIGMVAVAAASWLMARRSLSPIGRIARELQRLTAAHLDQRLTVPTEGDEVAEMVVTANHMLDRLQSAFEAQQQFMANAAHELKTPVTVLLGEAQVLSRQPRSAEDHERFAGSVQEEMRRLSQLIDGLLTLARARAGFPIPLAQPVSLNEVVTDAVQRCQPLARQRGVRLVLRLAPPRPDLPDPIVMGDGELLGPMVSNLVRNAIRHSPAKPDSVQAQGKPATQPPASSEAGTVEIEVAVYDPHHSGTDRAEAVVSVRDRGPGIPADLMERVFDPFFRVPHDMNTGDGAGLGLSIARGVAELHGGSIRPLSRPGGGCEFEIRLPIIDAVEIPT